MENNIIEIYMNKFAKYLLFVLLVVFAGLIVTSGANNLGLIEMMENMNESEEKKQEKNEAILSTETHSDTVHDF